jgi:hypothetical protein
MRIEADSRDAHFAAAGDRGSELRALDQLIRTHAPDLEPTNAGAMLGYGELPYQTKSMKEPGVWPLLSLAAQKNYLSLYVCAVVDGRYVAEQYAAELGKVNCGKSCVRFKKAADLDPDGLARMLTDLNQRYVAGEQLYGA